MAVLIRVNKHSKLPVVCVNILDSLSNKWANQNVIWSAENSIHIVNLFLIETSLVFILGEVVDRMLLANSADLLDHLSLVLEWGIFNHMNLGLLKKLFLHLSFLLRSFENLFLLLFSLLLFLILSADSTPYFVWISMVRNLESMISTFQFDMTTVKDWRDYLSLILISFLFTSKVEIVAFYAPQSLDLIYIRILQFSKFI